MTVNTTFYCSFCGSNQHERKCIIYGLNVYICDECVDLCNSIIKDRELVKVSRKVVIFDLDGTLADIEHRLHFLDKKPKDWVGFEKACVNDKPKEDIMALFDSLRSDEWHMLICSGRSDKVRTETIEWLNNQCIYFDNIYMRKEGDYRPDTIVKKEMLDEITSSYGKPTLVVDDRMSVVNMWREQGLTCLQCALWDDSSPKHTTPYSNNTTNEGTNEENSVIK